MTGLDDGPDASRPTAGSLTFIGTATTLIRLGAFTVLTDPNFLRRGQRAYLGRGLWSRRLTDPARRPDQLPRLDAIVLSHLHGDHFDRVARRTLDPSTPVLTTVHAARWLGQRGFDPRPLRTWETHTVSKDGQSLTVESLPAVHARGLMGRLLPPVMGSLLTHRIGDTVNRRIYLSGDTLTGEHVDRVRARHPDIDLAVVHLGGTRVLWHTVTMDAGQGVDFVRRSGARSVVPVHHDDYRVFRSPLSAFEHAAHRAGLGSRLRVVPRGATLMLKRGADSGPG